jgi:hypothetical protein
MYKLLYVVYGSGDLLGTFGEITSEKKSHDTVSLISSSYSGDVDELARFSYTDTALLRLLTVYNARCMNPCGTALLNIHCLTVQLLRGTFKRDCPTVKEVTRKTSILDNCCYSHCEYQ